MNFHGHLRGKLGVKLGRAFLWMGLIASIGGCESDSGWQLREVRGHLPDLRFSLVADSGNIVTERNFQGYTVLLYFGFTNCPDECPTTMARLADTLRRLGSDAERIRIMFVTVDPDRDTPEKLRKYLKAFDAAHATGLTGSQNEIGRMAQRYRAAYRITYRTEEQSAIVHSNAIYIFDSKGQARLLASEQDSDQALLSDLRNMARVVD